MPYQRQPSRTVFTPAAASCVSNRGFVRSFNGMSWTKESTSWGRGVGPGLEPHPSPSPHSSMNWPLSSGMTSMSSFPSRPQTSALPLTSSWPPTPRVQAFPSRVPVAVPYPQNQVPRYDHDTVVPPTCTTPAHFSVVRTEFARQFGNSGQSAARQYGSGWFPRGSAFTAYR